jgi:hypothetical protein
MKTRAPHLLCLLRNIQCFSELFPSARDEGPRGIGNRPYYVPRVESLEGLAPCVLARIGPSVRGVIFSTARFNWDIENLHNKIADLVGAVSLVINVPNTRADMMPCLLFIQELNANC